jgi:hypothetical protein
MLSRATIQNMLPTTTVDAPIISIDPSVNYIYTLHSIQILSLLIYIIYVYI